MPKSFKEFVNFRETSAYDVGRASVGGTTLSTSEEAQLSRLFKAVGIAWSKYRMRTLQFLKDLNDVTIDDLVKELEDDVSDLTRATRKLKPGDEKDDDIVTVPKADGNPGMEDGGWD